MVFGRRIRYGRHGLNQSSSEPVRVGHRKITDLRPEGTLLSINRASHWITDPRPVSSRAKGYAGLILHHTSPDQRFRTNRSRSIHRRPLRIQWPCALLPPQAICAAAHSATTVVRPPEPWHRSCKAQSHHLNIVSRCRLVIGDAEKVLTCSGVVAKLDYGMNGSAQWHRYGEKSPFRTNPLRSPFITFTIHSIG